MMFVGCLQLVWPAVFHWQRMGELLQDLFYANSHRDMNCCVWPEDQNDQVTTNWLFWLCDKAVHTLKKKTPAAHLPRCGPWSLHTRARMLPVPEKGCHFTPGSLGDWHGQQPSLQPIPLSSLILLPFLPHLWRRRVSKEEAGHVRLRERSSDSRKSIQTHTFRHTHTTHTLSRRKWNKCWLHSAVSSLTHCYPLAGMPQRKRSFTFGAYGG